MSYCESREDEVILSTMHFVLKAIARNEFTLFASMAVHLESVKYIALSSIQMNNSASVQPSESLLCQFIIMKSWLSKLKDLLQLN